METSKYILFQHLRNEVEKYKGRHRQTIRMMAPEACALLSAVAQTHVVPEEYINFQGHINQINAFKGTVTDPKVLDDLTELLKVGKTIEECRKYYGEINKQWNKWAFCCTDLQSAAHSVEVANENILRHMNNAIIELNKLILKPGDLEAQKSLESNIEYIKRDDLGNIYTYSKTAIDGVDEFQKTFDEQQKSYDKIINQLTKESALQESEKTKIKNRIDELNNDIASYNATIAAIAIGMGVATTLVFISFKVGGVFSFVVGLFLVPAFVGMSMALSDVIAKIKLAKKEIESYGDYKSAYDGIIKKLSEIQGDIKDTKDKSVEIKDLLSCVISPWTSLRKDLDSFMEYISETGNYETALNQFKEGQELWSQISSNARYLQMPVEANVIMQNIPVDTEIKIILGKAQEKGVSMLDYLRQRSA